MKKLATLLFAAFFALQAQAQVTTLWEDFNTSCATSGQNYPLNWSEWNVIPPVAGLAWTCTVLGGRDGTGGMQCNSYFSGTHYLDTAWLFTPQLILSGYTDSVYLRFDSRYNFSGARMQVLYNHHYYAGNPPDSIGVPSTWGDLAARTTPVIGPDDSTGWITHYVNLTSYKSSPLYVAFRYASTAAAGGSWTIDNVMLTPFAQGVNDVVRKDLGLTIIGNSSNDKITFSCSFPTSGNYDVAVYDNIGKVVYKSSIYAGGGIQSHTIGSLTLGKGMYFVRVGNSTAYGVAKTIVE